MNDTPDINLDAPVGVVIIGRNEGARLIRCLKSVSGSDRRVVYVDSGSNDGSQDAATAAGADVVALDTKEHSFTAARARNAGLAVLTLAQPRPEFVQFIDGDCELQPDWIPFAHAFLQANAQVAVACGRRRELYPTASVYNRLIDQEWDTPVGQTKSCGGDALMRLDVLNQIGGFNPNLIAGEEPELCVRLRQAGWEIWRLDAEMTLHDACLTSLFQWWKRNKRAGHAYGEGAAMHGRPPENHGRRETRSALFWGMALPVSALLGLLISPWSLLLLLAWPAQVLRLAWRDKDLTRAFFLTLGKLPEAQGILEYWWNRLRGSRTALIEYK